MLHNLHRTWGLYLFYSKTQPGLTLTGLIAVVVILGLLAATAVPRYIGISGDAISGDAIAAQVKHRYAAYKTLFDAWRREGINTPDAAQPIT